MDFSNLFITGFILNNLYLILTTTAVLLFRNYPIYNFDSASDPINTEDLLKKIREDNSFIKGYTFKEGTKKPEGLFYNFSKKYIGYIKNYQTSNNFSTKVQSYITFYGVLPITVKCLNNEDNSLDENSDSDSDSDNDSKNNEKTTIKTKTIKLYLVNSYYDGEFRDLYLPFNFKPYNYQKTIIDKIDNIYQHHPFNICRALIWGEPGGGKSFIGKLLAQKYSSAYCFGIKLLNPGTPILDLWQTVLPSKEKPLIIQIDEFDIIINTIHNNLEKNKPHQWLRTMITDKQSYNTFLSEYLICLPHVIYLFTMNSDPKIINALDTSYIRKNRIDLIMPLENKKQN